MNNYCHSCGPIDGFVYPDVKNLKDISAESYPDQPLLSCSKCGRRLLIDRQIELEESVSLPTLNPHAPIDLDQLVAILLPNINDAVRWAYLRYQGRIREDELDDLSQQIILILIEDNCRRFRSFNGQSSFKTWLQAVVNHHIYNYFTRWKQIESLNEVHQALLSYSPLLDQGIATAERRMLLSSALNSLSQQERLLYRLSYIFELNSKEIAVIFQTDASRIYKRKQRLLLKLERRVRGLQSQ
jgi:RNA polymerase sigma factor (sigma-70 family)